MSWLTLYIKFEYALMYVHIAYMYCNQSKLIRSCYLLHLDDFIIKGDLWAPYYRIIFELLDRLCQIIENPSFLLILQLSSFQSKIILWNDFWSSLNVILSKILKKGHFLKKMPKSKKPTTTFFYCCSFKSKKVTLSKVKNAGPKTNSSTGERENSPRLL